MTSNMTEHKNPDLAAIKLLVMDVDGVLTDGTITIYADGSESKRFHLVDGHGIKMWHRAGLQTAFLSARPSEATRIRAEQLNINYVFQGCKEKLPAFEQLLIDANLSAQNVAYVGDDVLDIPVATRVGFAVAVKNAVDELKTSAHYVTSCCGGQGAVREVIEYILKNTGRWDQLMQRYLV